MTYRRSATGRPVRVGLGAVLLLLAAALAWPAGAGEAEPERPGRVVVDPEEDCDFDPVADRWDCPVDAPGWARLDFTLTQPSLVGISFKVREVSQPVFWATAAWHREHQGDAVGFVGAGLIRSGSSDYERTVVKVGDVQVIEEERESSRDGQDRQTFFGHAWGFDPGTHTLYFAYGQHHSTELEETGLRLSGVEGIDTWTITHHPGRAWLFDDRDFEVGVAQVRNDGAGANVIVDATLGLTIEDSLAGFFLLGTGSSVAGVSTMSIDGPRSCTFYPNALAPALSSWLLIPPSPAGEYRFSIDTRAELSLNVPQTPLLLADLDAPVQPWPPTTAPNPGGANSALLGALCEGE